MKNRKCTWCEKPAVSVQRVFPQLFACTEHETKLTETRKNVLIENMEEKKNV